ncbi:MAG: sigma-54-dependent Fis family transcriptional regulator [Flavobacteriales bacterium]|nr:MAG: sigma-54-dependent Fis family transcriptional regulator [Flavobacteriales bacterium]
MTPLDTLILSYGRAVDAEIVRVFEERLSLSFRIICCPLSIPDDLYAIAQDQPVLLLLSMKVENFGSLRQWINSHPFMQMIVFEVTPEQAVLCHRSGAWELFAEDDNLSVRLPMIESRCKDWVELKMPRKEEQQIQTMSISSIAPGMRKIYSKMRRIRQRQTHMWLEGPAGSGKKMLAKQLHYDSPFKDRPFYSVNIHSGKDIEQQLFGGVVAGRFRPGYFELAEGGTVYLDGILQLPLELQAKLLQMLKTGSFERDNRAYNVRVRIVSAARSSSEERLSAGLFHQELHQLLSEMFITVPNLSERRDDIPLMAKHFAADFALKNDYRFDDFHPNSLRKLMMHNWPGNIRELRSVCELAVVVSDSATVLPEHVLIPELEVDDREIGITLHQNNIKFIQNALRAHNFNVVETADQIGVGKSTIYRMIKNGEVHLNDK